LRQLSFVPKSAKKIKVSLQIDADLDKWFADEARKIQCSKSAKMRYALWYFKQNEPLSPP
jgi:hypothetical protein